jgi:hypothetical protein
LKTARSRSKVQHLLSFSKKIGLKSQIEDAFDEEEAGRVIKYTLKLPEVRRTLRGKRYRILRCFSDTLKNRKEEGRLRYATSVIYNYSDDLTHVIRIDMKTGQLIDTQELAIQPGPSPEEYNEAISIIKKDQQLQEVLDSEKTVIQQGLIVQDPDEESPAGIHRCVEMYLLRPEPDRLTRRVLVDLSSQNIIVNEEA